MSNRRYWTPADEAFLRQAYPGEMRASTARWQLVKAERATIAWLDSVAVDRC